jgi:hypothetical protein
VFLRRLAAVSQGKEIAQKALGRHCVPVGVWRLGWYAVAAVFLVGLFSGVLGTLIAQGAGRTRPGDGTPAELAAHPPDVPSAISRSQAEELLHEVAAQGVLATLVKQVRNRDWRGAVATYETLLSDYAETAVVQKLDGNREVRLLKQFSGLSWRDEP